VLTDDEVSEAHIMRAIAQASEEDAS
jgi:hypothetical protein